jgi:NAD(P)-dependent dehydrogenase (short-subunit alcohol dehydrogenase family)
MTIDATLSREQTRRIAAVTGGGSGIGEATAYLLSNVGFDIAVLDYDMNKARAVAQRIGDRGGSALPVCVDVTDFDSVEQAFATVESWRKPVDVLINSAGIMKVASVLECPLEDFRDVMQVNVTGVFLCAQRAAKSMLAQKYGRIVNLASISAERAGIGRVAYGTSKGAVCALTRQLALELAVAGVTANCVAPGPISTPMTRDFYTPETRSAYESMIPMRRLGTVEEVAHAIAFLVSDSASYINGITLVVDGGYLAAGVGTTGTLQV